MWKSLSPLITTLAPALLMLVRHPTPGWGQNDMPIGTVLAVDGIAEVRAQNKTAWEGLRFRDAIFLQDEVRTGAKSKVKIIMRDDSIMTMSEQSQIIFTEFLLEPKRQRSVVNLLLGTLKTFTTHVMGAEASVEIQTPNAVVGVRGTIFVVRFIAPITDVFVLQGIVTAQNSDPAIPEVVQAPLNTRTRVVGVTPPTMPAAITAEERQAIEQAVQLIEQVPSEVTPSEELMPSDTPRGTEDGAQGREGAIQPDSTTVIVREGTPMMDVQKIETLLETAAYSESILNTAGGELLTPDTTPTAGQTLQELLITVEIPLR